MTELYGHFRMGLSAKGLSESDVRSLLLGEILWNISQIETEMSLVVGHALGMKALDALHTIRDLNFDSKIRILESHATRISIKFKSSSDRKMFFKDLRKLKDLRNTIAHGAIFSDAKGTYFNIPARGSVGRTSSSLPTDKSNLEKALVQTTWIASCLALGRAGGKILVGKE